MRLTVLIRVHLLKTGGFPCGSAGKESAYNAGELGLIPGLGRYPGEGNSYPLQYSGLENSMDCIIHGVAKSQTWLSEFHFLWEGFICGNRLKASVTGGFLQKGFDLHVPHIWISTRIPWTILIVSIGTPKLNEGRDVIANSQNCDFWIIQWLRWALKEIAKYFSKWQCHSASPPATCEKAHNDSKYYRLPFSWILYLVSDEWSKD